MTSGASATNSSACLRLLAHRPQQSDSQFVRCGHASSLIGVTLAKCHVARL